MRWLILPLALVGTAFGKPKATPKPAIPTEWQQGPCQGGNRPSMACKTCERCAYCGRKPGGTFKGARPENSGTCVRCAKVEGRR